MPASLLTLPVELVEHIVLLAIPPDEAVSQYQDRQRTLVSLRKTCKTLLQVAQPVLWRVFFPKSDPLPFLNQHRALARAVRFLHLDTDDGFARSTLERLDLLPNVQHVRVQSWAVVMRKQDWVALGADNIKELTLSDFRVSRANFTSLSFPNLVVLTLRSRLSSDRRLFGLSAFPHLRAFYTEASPEDVVDLQALVELDMLQIRVHWGKPAVSSNGLPYPVLVSFDLGQVDGHSFTDYRNFSHFQLDSSLHKDTSGSDGGLTSHHLEMSALTNFVKNASSLLSFSLPLEFHPSTSLPPDRRYLRYQLIKALEDRNVKIIWRLNSREAADDVEVSREFWRYAKELKARKALEAAERGEATTSGGA
ncbi:hypothetical protein JCM8097_006603 [Rhodosporidiobolus ruineniae]